MKYAFYIILVAAAFSVGASQFKAKLFNFIAPSVYDALTNAPKEVGSIVYDTSTAGFYGNDHEGNWVPLSASDSSDTYVSSNAALANYGTSAGFYGDLNSISLVAGEWDITAETVWYSNGATTTTQIGMGVSTTSGNSSAGMQIGDNFSLDQKNY